MPKLKENEIPSYRLHRQSGQAIVTLNGKDVLLGKHGPRPAKLSTAGSLRNGSRRAAPRPA